MIDSDDIPIDREMARPVCSELSRRLLLKLGAVSAGSLMFSSSAASKKNTSFSTFDEISPKQTGDLLLADGFEYKKIISFGDPLKKGMSDYDSSKLTAEEQQNRFGGSCDFTHFFQDPKDPFKGVLCVNNEGVEFGTNPDRKEREKAAYYSTGCSVVSLVRQNGKWEVDLESPLNRRVTPDTPAVITGAAAGNERMKSAFSKDGIKSAGTIGNCAGGYTPWGTYLTAEENIQSYFTGDAKKHPERENFKRFGLSGRNHFFHKIDDRFHLNSKNQSPLHFGWVVEIDPYSPEEPIKKHTCLGRAKHECAAMTLDKDGRAVVYTSDDQAFEYIYKFVSSEKYKDGDRTHNKKLLESGTLYVAKFLENGSMQWLPMIFGKGPLTAKNGFKSQGDVYIDTRKAADLLKATPMDRPEDIVIHPQTGNVLFFMTGNRSRKESQVNLANKVPRGSGHIIEMSGNHHSDKCQWSFLVICGQKLTDEKYSTFHEDTSFSGRFVYPDNGSYDNDGQLWICSDGYGFPGFSDGLWHCSVKEGRGFSRRFATAPVKAEFTGPCFSGKGLFLSVQHPGSTGQNNFPDFNGQKARSTVVYIQKKS